MAETRRSRVGVGESPATRARPPETLSRRTVIEHVRPSVDGGRFAVKRTPGEPVEAIAVVFADGHDVLSAVVRDRPLGNGRWRETRMTKAAPTSDEWHGTFAIDAPGWHEFAIVAWVDRFQTWRRDVRLKAAASQDVTVERLEGSLILRDAAARAAAVSQDDADWLLQRADALGEPADVESWLTVVDDGDLEAAMFAYGDRRDAAESSPVRIHVERERARFGAWYEMFPRSFTDDPRRSGTFREAAAHLPYVCDLGFDVVYLPPIHPIGSSYRKGANNSLIATADDPGSPWAIGSEAGGHAAIDPGLGTLDDFLAFQNEARRLGIEIALDLAWQCSPDHPWVREHPEWFRHRPDGTIKYAENPPKKYQDIYPLDFACDDWPDLWAALLDVTRFWVDRGVRIFRVDNPHTKTFGFWEWLIREVQSRDPDVLFLAEAFTRPAPMRYLAKLGFSQSYTYFTWRNTKPEIEEYLTELTATDAREFLRPNLFANTPDILHAYLQHGGRAAFLVRFLLAATLGSSYGIYSGFELCEAQAAGPGSEEYADSEKYQYRPRDWNHPGHIKETIARVNRIRTRERALQFSHNLRFTGTDNPSIVAYGKGDPGGSSCPLLVVVNLDPHHMQHGWVEVPAEALEQLAIVPGSDTPVVARDLLDDTVYVWRAGWNYVRFDPGVRQGHILRLEGRSG